MPTSQQPEETKSIFFSRASLHRSVLRASFLLIGACWIVFFSAHEAQASCGDHLQSTFHFDFKQINGESNNSPEPVRCIHCSYRSDAPLPLPLRTTEKVDKDSANVVEPHSDQVSSGDSVRDSLLLFVAQYFREVSTPPPKFPSLLN